MELKFSEKRKYKCLVPINMNRNNNNNKNFNFNNKRLYFTHTNKDYLILKDNYLKLIPKVKDI